MQRTPSDVLKRKFDKLARKGLNIKEIAVELGYNPTYFGTRMKKVLGMWPSIYIQRIANG